MNKFIAAGLICSASGVQAKHDFVGSNDSYEVNPHGHTHFASPIGLMAGHTHKRGEWMFSYRYMFMNMEDNYVGEDSISRSDVFGRGYMVSPIDMQMEMHMLGVMYAPTDRLTFMGMLNLLSYQMLHDRNPKVVSSMGGERYFTTETQGIGDASLGALLHLLGKEANRLHLGFSVVLPTASTDERDDVPGMVDTILPYPMQLGSGSWGLKPSLTYSGHAGIFSWGAQVSGQINLADNQDEYRLGDSIMANLWGGVSPIEGLNTTVRVESTLWDNIEGSHRALSIMPGVVPTADPSLRGGRKLDIFLGASYQIPRTSFTIATEFGQTLWQDLDGPQLGSDWTMTLGVLAAF